MSPVGVAAESTQAPASATTTEPANTASGEPQVQTTLEAKDREMDSLRKYLAILKKRLQAKLIYPEEAKRIGYEGATMLKFVITEKERSGTARWPSFNPVVMTTWTRLPWMPRARASRSTRLSRKWK